MCYTVSCKYNYNTERNKAMTLIKCPECGKDVSNKANICIHCGYPLNEIKDKSSEPYTDLFTYGTSLFDMGDKIGIKCEKCGNPFFISRSNFKSIEIDEFVISDTVITCTSCDNKISPNTKIPSLYYRNNDTENLQKLKEQNERIRQSANSPQPQPTTPPLPTCPRCGSTSITTGARGVSGFWGFIGASKTVNRCANCGHTWTPKV